MKPHKISTHSAHSENCYVHFFISCLIELKFYEVSRNSISKRCWKFQLSILKNKKVLFLKKYFLAVVNIKTKNFVYWLNFQRRFWFRVQWFSCTILSSIKFRYLKVASSRLIYYSILNHFGSGTKWDVLLTETCYY